jgi:hypothetical protein
VDFKLYDDEDNLLAMGNDYLFQNNRVYLMGSNASVMSYERIFRLEDIFIDLNTPEDLIGDRVGIEYDENVFTKNEYKDVVLMLLYAALGGPTIKNLKKSLGAMAGVNGKAIDIIDKYNAPDSMKTLWINSGVPNSKGYLTDFDFVINLDPNYTSEMNRMNVIRNYLNLVKPAYTNYILNVFCAITETMKDQIIDVVRSKLFSKMNDVMNEFCNLNQKPKIKITIRPATITSKSVADQYDKGFKYDDNHSYDYEAGVDSFKITDAIKRHLFLAISSKAKVDDAVFRGLISASTKDIMAHTDEAKVKISTEKSETIQEFGMSVGALMFDKFMYFDDEISVLDEYSEIKLSNDLARVTVYSYPKIAVRFTVTKSGSNFIIDFDNVEAAASKFDIYRNGVLIKQLLPTDLSLNHAHYIDTSVSQSGGYLNYYVIIETNDGMQSVKSRVITVNNF